MKYLIALLVATAIATAPATATIIPINHNPNWNQHRVASEMLYIYGHMSRNVDVATSVNSFGMRGWFSADPLTGAPIISRTAMSPLRNNITSQNCVALQMAFNRALTQYAAVSLLFAGEMGGLAILLITPITTLGALAISAGVYGTYLEWIVAGQDLGNARVAEVDAGC